MHFHRGGNDAAADLILCHAARPLRILRVLCAEACSHCAGTVSGVRWGVRGRSDEVPAKVAETMRPFLDLGFSHINVRVPAPHDRETIERLGEIREQLGDLPFRGG